MKRSTSFSFLDKVSYGYVECFNTRGWTCYTHDMPMCVQDLVQDICDIRRRHDGVEQGHYVFSSMKVDATT